MAVITNPGEHLFRHKHSKLKNLEWSEAGHTIDANIVPTASGTQSVGISDIAFNSGYFDTIYGDGSNITNISSYPLQNTVSVYPDADEVIGKNYKTIASAIAYVNTKSPTTSDRWCIQLGAGTYTENFSVPAWVTISGAGAEATELTGQVDFAGGYVGIDDIFMNTIQFCKLDNVYLDTAGVRAALFLNCHIEGADVTANGASTLAVLFDCTVRSGDWTGCYQFQAYRTFILGGTFASNNLTYITGCSIIPYEAVNLNGEITIEQTSIWYQSIGTVNFDNTANIATLRNCSYNDDPTFNAASRTFNFYNCTLNNATFTAGTFNQITDCAHQQDNVVQVSSDVKVKIPGKAYATIAEALAYIATQTPAEDNRWTVMVTGNNSETFEVPAWVCIEGDSSTRLTGTVSTAGMQSALYDYQIRNLVLTDLQVGASDSVLLDGCMVQGFIGGASSIVYSFRTAFFLTSSTDTSGMGQFVMIDSIIGPFGAADIVLGGPANLTNSYILNFGYTGIEITGGDYINTVIDTDAVKSSTITSNARFFGCNSTSSLTATLTISNGATVSVDSSTLNYWTFQYDAGGTLEVRTSILAGVTDNGGTFNNYGEYYDNTTSGLVATDVKAAIDELAVFKLDASGYFRPVTSADADAPGSSVFYSSDQSKLVYKDPGGTIRDLY